MVLDSLTIRIIPNASGNPPGKLADAELHFTAGPLAGLRLIGFAIWESRAGGRSVTLPSRSYAVNGERRSFVLLRPSDDPTVASVYLHNPPQDRMRALILEAYAETAAELEASASV